MSCDVESVYKRIRTEVLKLKNNRAWEDIDKSTQEKISELCFELSVLSPVIPGRYAEEKN